MLKISGDGGSQHVITRGQREHREQGHADPCEWAKSRSKTNSTFPIAAVSGRVCRGVPAPTGGAAGRDDVSLNGFLPQVCAIVRRMARGQYPARETSSSVGWLCSGALRRLPRRARPSACGRRHGLFRDRCTGA
jgi:hypothetical protein